MIPNIKHKAVTAVIAPGAVLQGVTNDCECALTMAAYEISQV